MRRTKNKKNPETLYIDYMTVLFVSNKSEISKTYNKIQLMMQIYKSLYRNNYRTWLLIKSSETQNIDH